jgi:hypothetical protein
VVVDNHESVQESPQKNNNLYSEVSPNALFPTEDTALTYDYIVHDRDTGKVKMTYQSSGESTLVKVNMTREGNYNPYNYYFEYLFDKNNTTNDVSLSSLSVLPLNRLYLRKETQITTISDTKVQYPQNLRVGQELSDAQFLFQIPIIFGERYFTYDGTVSDRKVLEKSSVQLNGSTLDCYKIAYNISIDYRFINNQLSVNKLMTELKVKVTDWFIPNYGIVKRISETNSSFEYINQEWQKATANDLIIEEYTLENLTIED